MSGSLTGKVALVTGASSGIGREAALAMARAGARVMVGARRKDAIKQLADEIVQAGGEALFVQTDVTDVAQVNTLVEKTIAAWGQLDIAFNNAGIEGEALRPMIEDTTDNFKQILDINVMGVWHAMRAEIPHMTDSGGAIINTSSVAGHKGFGTFAAYTASKFAVEGLTRSVAQELAPSGIRVNTVAPGPIVTPMLDRATQGDHSAFESMIPMGRLGQAGEIADAVVFLASDAASYITGQSLVVDGGMVA